ncbi:retinal guanylyl cyclase 2-like isoform X2 [Alosa alosa]|uniref:retinal guanylyl cyclase 2-like isoform X2 n=1 Tax=Alosa alosa TaxID=278164 RepID=UPI00201509D8|nr:retinal guanylyl cyclase 2-like isoform X2 [Alosa alosa]
MEASSKRTKRHISLLHTQSHTADTHSHTHQLPILRTMFSWLWVWLWVATAVLLPAEAWGTTFKVALVGPWTCDPMFAKALPDLAARLAMVRINKDPRINSGYWYDYTLVSEDCRSSRALARFAELKGYGHAYYGPFNPIVCSAAALLTKNWHAGLLSPGCLDPGTHEPVDDNSYNGPMRPRGAYTTFGRPLPLSAHVLFQVFRFFRWAHVGVVSAQTDLWEATGQELASALRALGLPVSVVATMEADDEGPQRALNAIRETDAVKVVIMCMHSALIGGEEQKRLLTTAMQMSMVDRGYVFIPYDTLLYSLPYQDVEYPALTNDSTLRRAYDGVLTITQESDDRNFYEAFRDAQAKYEIRTSTAPEQVSPLFGSIYNSLYYIAMAVEQTRSDTSGRWVTGEALANSKGDFEFEGFNQQVYGGQEGAGMQVRYVVLDTNGMGGRLRRTHMLEAAHTNARFGGLKYMGQSIHFAGSSPSRESYCWFSPYMACNGGLSGMTIFFLFLFLCVLVGGGIAFAIRNRDKLGGIGPLFGGGDGGPTKLILTLDDVLFINTSLSKKKMNEESMTKSLVDVKTPYRSVCGRSYIQTSPNSTNIAMYEGDWVWLKKCSNGDQVTSVTQKTTNLINQLRDMRHENLNLYIGLFLDVGIFAVVTEHCSRGSLEDLLANEDMRLDWMFKSSLLLDLIRGMRYLHWRGITHGRLKSRNCVVDGRFVLKVTEYGYASIMEAQGVSIEDTNPTDMLWTAPELLRSPRASGTFAGDVYSCAIIIQEVITRSAPFCMMDMPAKEVINKLRSPPPLCRPEVSLDDAPLECIQLMKQCWSEDPDKRPTFEEVFKQFKQVNKGKKTNIIDSMLRMLEQYSSNLEDLIRERTEELEVERQKTDKLVAAMLPRSVAQTLKLGKPVEPEGFNDTSLYFSDIVGFTTISALSEPIEVVDLLGDLYTIFDAIIGEHDVYKVETIGDAYMVASGVPNRNGNRHAAEISNMALDILHAIGTFRMKHMPDVKIKIRIGLHSGPVVAGVVGLTMPRYCLFGDTVNTASRMESTGLPYRIHMNQSIVDILTSLKLGYKIVVRGNTELKGKGHETTYWLVGREGYTKELPVPPDLTGGASNHGISLEDLPLDRRQKFLDRQNQNKKS